MELVRANAQGELTALERGMHALWSGMDMKAYAESVGRPRKTVSNEVLAARVAETVARVGHDLTGRSKALVGIHAAPRWLWPALVERLVTEGLTVEVTRKLVADLKDVAAPPAWAGANAIADALVSGEMRRPRSRRWARPWSAKFAWSSTLVPRAASCKMDQYQENKYDLALVLYLRNYC
ncbi:hypothetical protein LRS73_18060 [Methylobacterium currus]|uniref:hypothetical protein n=1 Tax=Methylobacterium currus TaxID=2051553 RepID=UPI001E373D14|nr:hypothetical protein [Methylobacterium currus]UHC14453.1 hypothetical protein LRS73_18060 [Methylobacterium currus]